MIKNIVKFSDLFPGDYYKFGNNVAIKMDDRSFCVDNYGGNRSLINHWDYVLKLDEGDLADVYDLVKLMEHPPCPPGSFDIALNSLDKHRVLRVHQFTRVTPEGDVHHMIDGVPQPIGYHVRAGFIFKKQLAPEVVKILLSLVDRRETHYIFGLCCGGEPYGDWKDEAKT